MVGYLGYLGSYLDTSYYY